MRDELEKQLYDRFPNFFPKDPNTLVIRFGFEHDDGWFDLLWDTLLQIEAECKRLEYPKSEYPKLLQVKEKFARLRIYVGVATDLMYNILTEAEKKSGYVCEYCGEEGTIMAKGGWIKTVCAKHSNGFKDIPKRDTKFGIAHPVEFNND